MRRLGRIVCALGGLWLLPGAYAQEADQGPGLDFLEYLGAWAEDDGEWLAIEEWQKGNGTDDSAGADEDGDEPPRSQRNENDEGE
jgi:hypothetical protein